MDKAAARAEKFGDLITADFQVLNEGWDSRNNHRYPVVVQDSTTQSIKFVQNANCSGNGKEISESRIRSLESCTLTIPWNLTKPVKIFPGIVARRYHTDQEHKGMLKELYVEWKKAPLQYQSSLDDNWCSDSMECDSYLPKVQDLLSEEKKLHSRDVLENHSQDRLFHLVHWLSITL